VKEKEKELIKQKVDEAAQDAWDLIVKKALEAGIKDRTHSMWLFLNRVNANHFAVLNKPRIIATRAVFMEKMTTEEPTPQAEKE